MCQFKSVIILKDRVFIPDYDSHSDMLEELGIADTRENAERLFVRAELSPADGDVFSDIRTWIYKVDQDILPDWYVEEYDRQRVIEAVKEWAKNRIHIGKDNFVISDGAGHQIKDCRNVVIKGSASVKYIRGNASVWNICGNASVGSIYDNASVGNIYGSARVEDIRGNASVGSIYGSASVGNICGSVSVRNICGSARVEDIYGNATVITSMYVKWLNRDKANLSDNATIKDSFTHTIYQAGDWQFEEV